MFLRLVIVLGLAIGLPGASIAGRAQGAADLSPGAPGRVVVRQAAYHEQPVFYPAYSATRDRLYAVQYGDPITDPTGFIIEYDPATGTVTRTFTGPVQPTAMAVSSSGDAVFIGYFGGYPATARVSRLNLDSGLVDSYFTPVVPDTAAGADFRAILPVPGQPDTVVLVQAPWYTSYTEVRVYDQGSARSAYYSYNLPLSDFAFTQDGYLVARDTTDSAPKLIRLSLLVDGVHYHDTIPLPTEVATAAVVYHDGLAYFASGHVVDLTTQVATHRYELPMTGSALIVDPITNRVHVLLPLGDSPSLFSARDLDGLGTIPLPGTRGASRRMVSMGSNRLVISDAVAGGLWFYTLAEWPVAAFLPSLLQHDLGLVVRDYPITNRCSSVLIPNNGVDIARMDVCVTNVQERIDGNLNILTRWTATFLVGGPYSVTKYSDAGNTQMYLRDSLGHRYDHIDLIGAAAQNITFTSAFTTTTGGYVFPGRAPGATVFAFHDDDQGTVIADIRITP